MLWKSFVNCVGFTLEDSHVGSTILKWQRFASRLRGRQILYVVPAILVWELWKMRNSKRHGKDVIYRILHQRCLTTLKQLLKVTYPEYDRVLDCWIGCYDLLQNHRTKFSYTLVKWLEPSTRGFKCNTDGRESQGQFLCFLLQRLHRGCTIC